MELTASFDFSGEYVFVANRQLMHRLDESIRPLLEARGGRITRIYTDQEGKASASWFTPATLPRDFFDRQAIRAAFTVDYAAPPDLVPLSVPLIGLPHAFWTSPKGQLQTLRDHAFYLGNMDYYLSQDSAGSVDWEIVSLRRRDHVIVLPVGNLKLDELRRRHQAEKNTNCLMYCCGLSLFAAKREIAFDYIDACLRHFPEHTLYVRPFPGDRGAYARLEEHFRACERFRIDSSSSTLRHLPSAAALMCDDTSTVGMLYSLATGRRAVFLPAHGPKSRGVRQTAFPAVSSPEEMVAELKKRLAAPEGEDPELVRLRERLVYRPGHARELFYAWLARILSGADLSEQLAVPCEYVGDRHFADPQEAIAFFLRALRRCRLEQYQGVLALRSQVGKALCMQYSRLLSRQQQGLPLVLRIKGRACSVLDDAELEAACPIHPASPLEAYCPATQDFLRARGDLLRDLAQAGEEDRRIVLPDRNKRALCLSLAEQFARMFKME